MHCKHSIGRLPSVFYPKIEMQNVEHTGGNSAIIMGPNNKAAGALLFLLSIFFLSLFFQFSLHNRGHDSVDAANLVMID